MLYLESNQKCCNVVLPLRHGYIIQSSLLCLLPSGVWQHYISLDFVCVSVWTHVYARPVLLVQSDLFENVNEITVFQTSQAALSVSVQPTKLLVSVLWVGGAGTGSGWCLKVLLFLIEWLNSVSYPKRVMIHHEQRYIYPYQLLVSQRDSADKWGVIF